PVTGKEPDPGLKPFTLTFPPNHFVSLGFRPTIGPIASIRGGSPAAEAGFRKGDLIVKVDGHEDFDPMRLPTLCYERAGQSVAFVVRRSKVGGSTEDLTLTVRPDATPPWTERMNDP